MKPAATLHTTATLSADLYNSYVRAFRWASDRIGDTGIVCFVSSAGWLDNKCFGGFRKSLTDEFSAIYVFNLRGNQRTSGETSRKEGGKIFGSGSRTPIAVTMLVKNPAAKEQGKIYYHDIGDYLSRDDKLGIIADYGSMGTVPWKPIHPDKNNDWVNLRDPAFEGFAKIAGQKHREPMGIFETYSLGLSTNRDAWVYNFSRSAVERNMRSMVDKFNAERERYAKEGKGVPVEDFVDSDPTRIKWTAGLIRDVARNAAAAFDESAIVQSMYRPFCRQWVYFNHQLNERTGHQAQLFPTAAHKNRVICANGVGASCAFSALMTDAIPNLHMANSGQGFPLYWYERQDGSGLFSGDTTYVRHDGITDVTLADYRAAYGNAVSKQDIFHYVYGILHSPEYRERFADNLRKELPRIPLAEDFGAFSEAGRDLAALHLGYESVEPWPLEEVVPWGSSRSYKVEKLRHPRVGKTENKSAIVVNATLTLTGVPDDAYRYELNGQSALWWIMDRYQVKTDRDSGIVNDPNDWSDDPRYIVDLIKRIVRVSIESMAIVDALPALNERGPT